MFRFFRKNREAVKKYVLVFVLSIVSLGMVVMFTPLGTGDSTRAEANVLAEYGGTRITPSWMAGKECESRWPRP